MNARESILAALRVQTSSSSPAPPYVPPVISDLRGQFVLKAKASYAALHEVASRDEIPEAVFGILSSASAVQRVHLPPGSSLRALPWHRTPGLDISDAAPGSEASALSQASCGIAETGTLVFAAGAARPSSWHFLPGRELVVLEQGALRATLEEAIDALRSEGELPSTVNLVTGPSRTGDIEQTMERGAHGPREVHILLTR